MSQNNHTDPRKINIPRSERNILRLYAPIFPVNSWSSDIETRYMVENGHVTHFKLPKKWSELPTSLKDSTPLNPKICKLSFLKVLLLSDQKINYLPANFDNLQQLINLDLSINNISKLPPSFKNLSKLTTLRLNKNQLTKIPIELSHLEGLEFLDLSNNQINKIPDYISKLKNLRSLNLEGNQISTLPESFKELKKI
ncbi:hypothetical protein ES708_09323 [subsurface metagenome]